MTQATRYIHGHAFGEVTRPKRDLPINEETVQDMKRGFETLTSEGYYPPILRAHKPDTDSDDQQDRAQALHPRPVRDGFTYGRVVDLLSSNDDRAQQLKADESVPTPDKEGVWYGIQPAEGVGDAIDMGYIDQWSPSVYRQVTIPHPEMADKPLEAVPRHLAFVSEPYQKKLEGSPHYKDLDEMGVPIDEAEQVVELGEDGDELFFFEASSTPPDHDPVTRVHDDFPIQDFQHDEESTMPDNAEDMLEDIAGTIEANAEVIDEMGETVSNLEDRIDSLSEDEEEEGDLSTKAKRLQAQVDDLQATVEDLKEKNEDLQAKRCRELALDAGVDEDEVDEVVDLASDDPIAFTRKLIDKESSQPEGGRPPKGGSGGPKSDDLSAYEDRQAYLVENYSVQPGTEEYIEKYEKEFDESPYTN